jgi:GNAT superfamily N-acetyltransferase
MLTYRPLAADTITREFTCGEDEIDRWFRNEALADHERGTILTTCAYLPGVASPAGFYSLASVAEEVSQLPGHDYHRFGKGEHFPCLQLVYLAVHRRYQRRGIGTSMVGAVLELFAEIGPKIGLPHLILVPINDDVISYYQDQLGFEPYHKDTRMFYPLQAALQAVQEAQPGDAENGGNAA